MDQSTNDVASLAETWEEVAENPESLEKQLNKVKIINRSSPEKEALKQQPSCKQVTIVSGDEQRRTQYVPETKLTIMKRPSQSASDAAAAARPKVPLKTLEQRQAEYNEARIRILGIAEPVIHDKTDSASSSPSTGDATKNCSPVAQGAQRGLITGAAARQQQQVKQQPQRNNKQSKTPNNSQNKRGNIVSPNNNQVNHLNGSQLADPSVILQQQVLTPTSQGPQPSNVPTSAYNPRVPQFYSSEGQAVIHHYQQPPAFVPAHCYPPAMSSCQQFPTSMPVQQLASPLSQQFTMPTQDFAMPVNHQQYPGSGVTIGPYGAALSQQHYLPHTVAGATPGAVFSPYQQAPPQHPYSCFPRMQYQLPGQPPMMSLHHHHQQQPPLPPTSYAVVSQQQQSPVPQSLPTIVETPQLPAVQQPRQQSKKQSKQKNKKNVSRSDNSTSPIPVEGGQHSASVCGKIPTTSTNGSDSALLTDAVGEASLLSPRGVSPEESVDPTPMETIVKKKNKKKKKKAQAKTSPVNPSVAVVKSSGTLSSKEGNGRIIRMPRGPDGTKGFNWVR